MACRAVANKLRDEIYFKIELDESMLKQAKIGGLTDFDINLPMAIDKSNLQLVTNEGGIMTSYDFVRFIYEKVKDREIFREFNEDFFCMFEMEQQNLSLYDDEIGKTI